LRDDARKIRYAAPSIRPADKAVAERLDGAIIAAIRNRHPELFAAPEVVR
jgi:hypothetical protein